METYEPVNWHDLGKRFLFFLLILPVSAYLARSCSVWNEEHPQAGKNYGDSKSVEWSNITNQEIKTRPKGELKALEISYKIENTEFDRPFKGTFKIRIDKQLTEEQIRFVANQIIAENPGIDRYFILYWLPNMNSEDIAWATSHFRDNRLEINIMGASQEEESKLKAIEITEGETIGRWFDSTPLVYGTIIIYRKGKAIKLKEVLRNNETIEENLKQEGSKFSYPNDFGEFFSVGPNLPIV